MQVSSLTFCSLTILLTTVLLVQCTPHHQLHSYTFEDYIKEFNKFYEDAEEVANRKATFEERLAQILLHNSDKTKTWKQGVNHLTDRTTEELKAMRGYDKTLARYMKKHNAGGRRWEPTFKAIPAEVDWRKHEFPVNTAVKDQGQCGSCWTFATAETVESAYAIKTRGTLPLLSQQHLLDCTPNPLLCGGAGGCSGGTAELAYQGIMKRGGIASEWTYPYYSYFGGSQVCLTNTTRGYTAVNITDYVKLPSNQYEPLLEAVAHHGPIAISVDASAWHLYESGVFDGCNQTNPDIDHAVVLVGYGSSDDGDFWIVRNSWSPLWGEQGYIRLRRYNSQFKCGTDLHPADGTGCRGGPATVRVCGTCGILYDTSYPIL